MANWRPTLYIGITRDLIKRAYEHKNGLVNGFTKKYQLTKLVYYEVFDNVKDAIKREKTLKRYRRQQKIELIKNFNSKWKDLYKDLL